MSVKYDPSGNRIFKDSSATGERKYIVDVTGKLPVILLEMDSADNMDIMKKYIYANGQVLTQHDIDDDALPAKDDMYFYLHDRLGSVRQVIDNSASVVKYYTYQSFGKTIEDGGTFDNPFQFTGQYFDSEIKEYYLRARQYDPHIARFTARDPVFGQFYRPLTLHSYLYCMSDPVNMVDPEGRWAWNLVSPILSGHALYWHGVDFVAYAVSSKNWKFFHLADLTFKFMPVGMAMSSVISYHILW